MKPPMINFGLNSEWSMNRIDSESFLSTGLTMSLYNVIIQSMSMKQQVNTEPVVPDLWLYSVTSVDRGVTFSTDVSWIVT